MGSAVRILEDDMLIPDTFKDGKISVDIGKKGIPGEVLI